MVNNFITIDFQTQVFIWLSISMKFCTWIINIKWGYESAIAPWWVGFSAKLYLFYPFKIDLINFSKSAIITATRKIYSIAIISCLKWTFHLFLQRGNFLTQTSCLSFWDHLRSSWNQYHCVVNDLFSQLTKQLFYST